MSSLQRKVNKYFYDSYKILFYINNVFMLTDNINTLKE